VSLPERETNYNFPWFSGVTTGWKNSKGPPRAGEGPVRPPASELKTLKIYLFVNFNCLKQWYSTFFVRVPPDIISLQLCTPKVVGT
jgi:hypothetical protein